MLQDVIHMGNIINTRPFQYCGVFKHCVMRWMCVCACAESFQSCLTLWDAMDCSLPGSSVREILQARVLEWLAMPPFRGSSQPRNQTQVSYTAGGFFTMQPPGKPNEVDSDYENLL